MKRLALSTLCLLMASCADMPVRPAVEIRTVTVEKIVPVTCVKKSDLPAEPAHVASQLTDKAKHDLTIVAASALDLRTWGETLYAMLLGCSATP